MLYLTIWAWRHRKAVGGKGSPNEWINQLMTRLFIKKPLAWPRSAKHCKIAKGCRKYISLIVEVSSYSCQTIFFLNFVRNWLLFRFVAIWVFDFRTQNWILDYFFKIWDLNFVKIWVLDFCQKLCFKVLSQLSLSAEKIRFFLFWKESFILCRNKFFYEKN